MASLFETFHLPTVIEEREEEIKYRWQSKFARDNEFRDITAGPRRLITQLANTVRNPQDVEQGPDPIWNAAVVDLVGDEQTIGVVGCKLRYLVAAVEDTVFSNLPDEQQTESLWRLHRAAYLGLESAARASAKEIATIAFYSTVTGLPNRPAFNRDIERIAARKTRSKLVYVDMDGLKIINDDRGHIAGDEALRRLGEGLSIELGEQDRAYHFSGDEFCVIMQEADDNYVKDFMSRVSSFGGPGFSYGAAGWPDEGSSWTQAQELADARMQENKRERKERGEAPERPQ